MINTNLPQGVAHTVPPDLRKALTTAPRVLAAWHDITPLARNEWICWVENAKLMETRKRRINRTSQQLKAGKRRPCCWAGCTHRTTSSKREPDSQNL